MLTIKPALRKILFFAVCFLLFAIASYAQTIQGSGGAQEAQSAGLTPVLQRVFNFMSVLIVLFTLIYLGFQIKALISSDSQQEGDRKKHFTLIGIIIIGNIIWFSAVPYFLSFATK